MHAFLEGVLMYSIRVFAAQLTTSQKSTVDHLVGEMFVKGSKSSERKNFPRVSFANGITNLTLLTADEWGGVAFTLLLLSITPRGQNALHIDFTGEAKIDEMEDVEENKSVSSDRSDTDNSDTYSNDNNDCGGEFGNSEELEEQEVATDRHVNAKDFIQLVEMLLSFHAWYEKGAPFQWTEQSQQHLTASIRSMMAAILSIVPRKKGFGWKVQKFHEMLHIPVNVSRFGSPQNFDASNGERSLKHWAKHPAKTSHKGGARNFTIQVANRVYERNCMEKCKKAMQFDQSIHGIRHMDHKIMNDTIIPETEENHDNDPSQEDNDQQVHSELVGKPKFSITFHSTGSRAYTYRWLGKQQQHSLVTLHPSIKSWLVKDHRKRKFLHVEGYTEYRRDGLLFRAHPNYRSEGAWYDWCMVQFNVGESHDDSSTTASSDGYWGQGSVPAKILCFLVDPTDSDGDGDSNKNRNEMVLCHCCEFSTHEKDSTLCEVWELEYEKKTSATWNNFGNYLHTCIPTPLC